MKIAFISTGIALLVIAVNLMAIYRTLSITKPQEKEIIKKLIRISYAILGAGLAILIIGIPVRLMSDAINGNIITGAGMSVLLTGFYTLFRAIGHKSVNQFKNFAWGTCVLSLIFFILYFIA
jgi:hypothetical protein